MDTAPVTDDIRANHIRAAVRGFAEAIFLARLRGLEVDRLRGLEVDFNAHRFHGRLIGVELPRGLPKGAVDDVAKTFTVRRSL